MHVSVVCNTLLPLLNNTYTAVDCGLFGKSAISVLICKRAAGTLECPVDKLYAMF